MERRDMWRKKRDVRRHISDGWCRGCRTDTYRCSLLEACVFATRPPRRPAHPCDVDEEDNILWRDLDHLGTYRYYYRNVGTWNIDLRMIALS